jgi:hypothetical protein
MRILGVKPARYGSDAEAYIVDVSVEELRKVANKAGFRDDETLAKLKVGDEYPLGEGHDFRRDIVNAAQRMETAYTDFVKAVPTMQRFVGLVAQQQAAVDATGRAEP